MKPCRWPPDSSSFRVRNLDTGQDASSATVEGDLPSSRAIRLHDHPLSRPFYIAVRSARSSLQYRFCCLFPSMALPRIFFLPLALSVAPTTSYAVAASFIFASEYEIKGVQWAEGASFFLSLGRALRPRLRKGAFPDSAVHIRLSSITKSKCPDELANQPLSADGSPSALFVRVTSESACAL